MKEMYNQDQYQREFIAEIVEVIEQDGEYHVVLDQTYFYPEGGGQPSDRGEIDNCSVRYVYEDNDRIYHICQQKPNRIHRVKCAIDWSRRMDHMQHHMAQHILSACLLKKFGANTTGFHLGKEICTIDIDKQLTADQLMEGEQLANEIISENILTEVLYPTLGELKKLGIKKDLSKVRGSIRIVRIGELDINPCCGLHPRSTMEVQLITVLKWEKYKSYQRISFIAGKRAIQEARKKTYFAKELCQILKGKEEEVIDRVKELNQRVAQLNRENGALKGQLADYQVKEMIEQSTVMKDIRIVLGCYEGMSVKDMQLLGNKLANYPKVIALLGATLDQQAQLMFVCSKDIQGISMNGLLKDCITLVDGKGGGNDFSAQGAGKSVANLSSALDYALMKAKHTLG